MRQSFDGSPVAEEVQRLVAEARSDGLEVKVIRRSGPAVIVGRRRPDRPGWRYSRVEPGDAGDARVSHDVPVPPGLGARLGAALLVVVLGVPLVAFFLFLAVVSGAFGSGGGGFLGVATVCLVGVIVGAGMVARGAPTSRGDDADDASWVGRVPPGGSAARTEPDSSQHPVFRLDEGSVVRVEGHAPGGWVKVVVDGEPWWIDGSRLRRLS